VVGGSALTWWTRDAGTEKWKDSLEYKAACNGLSTHTFGSATSTGGPASPPCWFVGPFQRWWVHCPQQLTLNTNHMNAQEAEQELLALTQRVHMNIRTTDWMTGRKASTDLADYADYWIRRTDASGQLETVENETRQLSRSLSRLINLLASKGLLTADEIIHIVCSYDKDPVLETKD
jgi:hypothetical protein